MSHQLRLQPGTYAEDLEGRSSCFALFRAGGGSALATLITATCGAFDRLDFFPSCGLRSLLTRLPHRTLTHLGALMAATCEISNVFSNYFNAMYSSEDPTLAPAPPTTFGTEDLVLTLNNQQMTLEGPEKASWTSERPQFWSKTQVLEWISYQVEKNKYDASSIDFSRCDMDGATLCSCALEELRLVFGPLGDQLHAQLRDLTSNSSDELSSDVSTARTATPQSSHASDSGGSDVDLDLTESKVFPRDGFPDYKKGEPKHGKRKRGRPRKLSKEYWDCLEGKKSKHAPRGTHLWEFIRDILIHPELNEGLMKWENRHEGVFKFLRSEAVAQLWGQKKKNSNMTYEKLSRAMRYYYKREILERVDGRRLVYKFGKNSSGWKEEERGRTCWACPLQSPQVQPLASLLALLELQAPGFEPTCSITLQL